MKHLAILFVAFICIFITGIVFAADVAPPDIKQPGTQQGEASISSPGNCGCHFNYDDAVEPGQNWRGSMMGNASRDPIFWATMAIAEQDFNGAGDLCLRCHTTIGWYGGTSEPTDGSNVTSTDGVDCHTCHLMTNTDQSEWPGTMLYPFIANVTNGGTEGFYGSGMLSLWNTRVGPYADAVANHAVEKSFFHRSIDFCGSCHDVSNPVVGNLAPNNGSQVTSGTVIADYTLGGTLVTKAAFNNPPYMYGIVERTYSEYKSGSLSKTLVSDFTNLPADLQDGALQNAYDLAMASTVDGNYVDGDPRYFSCQTCHQPPVTGKGCNKSRAPVRPDIPYHDMTGGNYWIGDIIFYQHDNNQLLTRREMGETLTSDQVRAINAGGTRAMAQLDMAASLEVTGNTLKVTNLTAHKLISGYPEGRRMWLNIKWFDESQILIREDGAYGPIGAVVTSPVGGGTYAVESLTNLDDPNTKIYDAHYSMTEDWAQALWDLGYPGSLALSYDRMTGSPNYTLAELANEGTGGYHETFHFVLNNYVSEDDRIPPYGMSYDEAAKRNALPVPLDQYGNPGPGGVYDYWDEFEMNPPGGAARAEISLMYQGTSWEYIQFLWLANNKQNAFLSLEGDYMLDSWLNTGMAAPYVMGTASWEASGVMVDIYVDLQGDNRPKWEGWEVPITVELFNPGSDVMTAIPLYTFNGTTTAAPYGGGTRAYFQCPDPVDPGTYDITADSTTTLLNVKRDVGIW